jgi:CubicO group peptidase (beta-lactamase class C family)
VSNVPRTLSLSISVGILSAVMLLNLPCSFAAGETPASAADTDPRVMKWMQGFPPPKDKIIGQPDSNFFSFPKMRWTVCHFRELLPTTLVSRGLGAPKPLDTSLDASIDEVTFTPIGSDKTMTWKESLSANYTDGILVLHKGRIVYEHYSGCLSAAGKHGAMSMTKSMTGLLGEILVAEGKLDDTATVSAIIPELKDSAFGSATVRQVMDMTTGLDFSEDYSDPNAGIWVYSAAANPLPKPADYTGPVGYYEFLQTVKQKGTHGEVFGYKTVNTDALGWIIARTTGKSVPQLLSERIWARIGAEQDGYMTVDSVGTAFAGGGLSAGLRDLGRIGLLVLNEGMFDGERLFPAAAVKSIRSGGNKNAFEKAGYKTMPGGSYRGMWWVFHNAHGAFAARGVHGQTIYVDPTAEMVIVRFSSHPKAKNAYIDPTSLPAYQAVAEHLLRKASIGGLVGDWRIQTIRDAGRFNPSNTEFTVMSDGRFSFSIDCNRLMTRPEIEGDKMLFGRIASTRRDCRPTVEALERRLSMMLGAVRTFAEDASTGTLQLLDANGTALITLDRPN